MSEEEQKQTEETASMNDSHQMYVQQLEWDAFIPIVNRVTNVNRLYMYNMPNKAEKYTNDIVELIQTIDEYLSGEDKWRVTDEKGVRFLYNKEDDKLEVGGWVIGKPKLILCIPKLNSFFIVPDENATFKGSPSPTTIIQLSNCISIMPMVLSMSEVPDPEREGGYNISLAYEMLNQP